MKGFDWKYQDMKASRDRGILVKRSQKIIANEDSLVGVPAMAAVAA